MLKGSCRKPVGPAFAAARKPEPGNHSTGPHSTINGEANVALPRLDLKELDRLTGIGTRLGLEHQALRMRCDEYVESGTTTVLEKELARELASALDRITDLERTRRRYLQEAEQQLLRNYYSANSRNEPFGPGYERLLDQVEQELYPLTDKLIIVAELQERVA
jgi:hypothetical protein